MSHCSFLASWRVVRVCVLAAAISFSSGMVRAEDGIGGVLRFLFGGGQNAQDAKAAEIDLKDMDVAPGFENQYTPLLRKVLNAELFFAHKICDLDTEQFTRLERAGRLTVARLSQKYAQQPNQHETSGWPDAREAIIETFLKEIDAVLPSDVAERYRQEVVARLEARRVAAREMMTMLIDTKLSLTEEQYDKVGGVLDQNWEHDWSRNMQIFLYEDYAPMPSEQLVRPLLTERQRDVWSTRVNYGRIHFGWEQDLGLMPPWGDLGEVEFDRPVPASPSESCEEAE